MMRIVKYILSYNIFLFLLCTLLLACFEVHAQKKLKFHEHSFKKITDNIHFSMHPEPLRHFVEGNATIIFNERDVIVIDAGGTPATARQILNYISTKTTNPVSVLVNTHFHGDHTMGNQVFKDKYPGLDIISTQYTHEIIESRRKTFVSFFSKDSFFVSKQKQTDSIIHHLRNDPENKFSSVIQNLERYRNEDLYQARETYAEIKITPPNLTFDSSLTLYRGNKEFNLRYLGKGDTPGDAWVFLPKEKLLITGDAVVYPVPYGFSQTPVEWLATLKKAVNLDFEWLIPGHGNVQKGKTYLLLLIDLLTSVHDQVKKAIDNGLSVEQTKIAVDTQALEMKFTNNDVFLTYYFNEYFKKPIIPRMYHNIKNNTK